MIIDLFQNEKPSQPHYGHTPTPPHSHHVLSDAESEAYLPNSRRNDEGSGKLIPLELRVEINPLIL